MLASRSERLALLSLGLTVLTWASAFPLIHVALVSFTPVQLALLRYLVAAVLLAGYAVGARVRLPSWPDALRIAGLGIVGIALYGVLLSAGQKGVTAGAASTLISSSPVFMVVLAALFAGERPSAAAVAGMLTSFVGVALLASARAGGVGLSGHALLVVGAAVAGAIYSVFLRSYTLRYGVGPVLAVAMWGSVLALLPAAPGAAAALARAPTSALLAVVFLGAVPGILGYFCFAYAMTRMSAAKAGAALYLVPVVATLLSFWLLGEVPAPISLVGGALVIGGVMMVRRKPTPPSHNAPARAVLC